MVFEDRLDKRQAQSHANAVSLVESVVALGGEMRLSAAAAYLFRHTNAIVHYFKKRPPALHAGAEDDRAAPAGGGDESVPALLFVKLTVVTDRTSHVSPHFE